ncbi:CBS domain-containing protein [bacterium]|nr:CBS domain-containing protein [bacterium]
MQVITTHINADFDSLASMIAANKIYPDAKLVFPGSQERNLRYLLKIPEYKIPYLKLKEIDLSLIDLMILVDTRMADRIGDLAQALKNPGIAVHIFDHHPSHINDIHGELEVIRQVGATTTLFIQIFKEKGIKITSQEATIMALGIYEDTGCLCFSSTTPEDLYAAGYLLSQGANLNMVSDLIDRGLTTDQIELMNELLESLEIEVIKGIPVHIAIASIERYIADIAILAHKIRDIENVDCLFILVRMEDRIHFVARSRIREVDAGQIARELKGGGHHTAASATIKEMTLVQAKESLLSILRDKINSPRTAYEIMTSPVKTVNGDYSIIKTKELLNKYSINTIPVMGDQGELKGIITRQTIDKAIAHGMQNAIVTELMVSDLLTANPEMPIDKVRELMIESNQRFLPVMNEKNLVGVITKTDMLRVLHDDLSELNPSFHEKNSYEKDYHRSKNLNSLIKERLPEEIQRLLKTIGETSEELGFASYAVGGFVRDLILRVENLDIDIVVEGNGIILAEYLSHKTGARLCSHQKFATAVIILPGGFKVDIATARSEYYPKPVDLPNVEMSSIKHDLYRRDFTINTLALQLNPSHWGRLIDFFGGQRDLKDKKIRVMHSLSFVEDPTRVFRAIRFEQRYGFEIGKYTKNLILSAVKRELLSKLDGHRLFLELYQILQETDPTKSINRMREFGLLQYIHPSIQNATDLAMLIDEAKKTLTWYELLYLPEKVEKWLVYFLALTDPVKENNNLELIMNHFGLPARYQQKILYCHSACNQSTKRFYHIKINDYSSIYELLQPIPTEGLLYLMAKLDNPKSKMIISHFLTSLKKVGISLSGEDLKELGFTPGPVFKKILKECLNARLDGLVTNRNEEMEFVKKQFGHMVHGKGKSMQKKK